MKISSVVFTPFLSRSFVKSVAPLSTMLPPPVWQAAHLFVKRVSVSGENARLGCAISRLTESSAPPSDVFTHASCRSRTLCVGLRNFRCTFPLAVPWLQILMLIEFQTRKNR